MDNRSRRIIIWLPVILVAAITAGIFLGIRLQTRKQSASRTVYFNSANKVGTILNLVEKNYVDTLDSKRLVETAAYG